MTRTHRSVFFAALALAACGNTPATDAGGSGSAASVAGAANGTGGASATGGQTSSGGYGPGGAANQCGDGTTEELCGREDTQVVTRVEHGSDCKSLRFTAHAQDGRLTATYWFDAQGDFAANQFRYETTGAVCPADYFETTSSCTAEDPHACIFCAPDTEYAATLSLPACD